jgi:hypothetical protein
VARLRRGGFSSANPVVPENDPFSGVNVNDPAAPVGGDDLEPVDPSFAYFDEINRHDVAGRLGADDAHNIGEAFYLAVLVKIPRPVMVAVIVLLGASRERQRQDKSRQNQRRHAFECFFHPQGMSHIEAFNLLSSILIRRQAMFVHQRSLPSIMALLQDYGATVNSVHMPAP